MDCDLLIKDCSLLTSDFDIVENQAVAVNHGQIVEIGPNDWLNRKYQAVTELGGQGKLAMPGLVDAHTHVAQQFLRGRTLDEYPMVWTRILVPFESNLDEEDMYHSALLSCLEMIKSGTTFFADAGGPYMEGAIRAILESGMRAAITTSVMDMGEGIPSAMKTSPEKAVAELEDLYHKYHGTGNGRIKIWFGLRQVLTCSPELIRVMGEKAREYNTGLHIHLAEHKDEVSQCLEKYQQRPVEYLENMGVLGPNLLAAHCVLLSERDVNLMRERQVNIVHCPRSNMGNHGFPKTPRYIEAGFNLGIGSDGASATSLSLWDEVKVLRSGINAFYGLPIFDPEILPAKELLKMLTIGGAKGLLMGGEVGSLQVGKKADVILIDIDQPHISPTHKLVNTLVETVTGADVADSVIDGKVVMKNREVLTLDEERILFESKKRIKCIAEKAGI